MTKITTKPHNKKNSALLCIVFALFSALVVLASTIFATTVYSYDSSTAKTMGEAWNAFVPTKASVTYNFDTNPQKIVSMEKVYTELGTITSNSTHTIISGDNPTYINDNKATPANEYNYCITISTAKELLAFSYLTVGLPSGTLTSGSNATVEKFFKNANVKLGNNINFMGNSEYLSAQSSTTSPPEKAYILPIEDTQTKAYYSNGAYAGYIYNSGEVPKPFLPITGFTGVFDGQNFDISNLKIIRKSSLNSSGYDAFFGSIAQHGVAKNFGLSNLEFIYIPPTGGTDDKNTNNIAGICGSNEGAIEYVYCTGAKLNTFTPSTSTSESISVISDCPITKTVLTGTETGTATQYYTTGATGEGFGTTCNNSINAKEKRWYSTALSDRLPYAFPAAQYRLSGLAKQPTATPPIAADKFADYQIRTVADFVTFSHIYKEGFTAARKIEIVNDLDFRYIGEFSIIPNVFLHNPKDVTLFSVKIDGVIGTNVFTDRKTLVNMRLNAYLYHKPDKSDNYVSYGLFYDWQYANPPIRVYNLNFINCNVAIQNTNFSDSNTAAGLLVGRSKQNLDFRGIGSNGNVVAKDGDATIGNNYIGGIIGRMDNSKEGNGIPSCNLESICMTGNVYSGNRICQNKNFSTGGIIGYVDSAFKAITQNHEVGYNNIYVGGTVTGFLPKNSDVSLSATGGLVGSGIFSSQKTDILSGVYIDGIINNCPTNNGNANITTTSANIPFSIGGIIGETIMSAENNEKPNDLPQKYGIIQNFNTFKVVANINVNTANAASTYYVGGIAGVGRGLSFEGTGESLKTSLFMQETTENKCVISIYDMEPKISGKSRKLFCGNMLGKAETLFHMNDVINDFALSLNENCNFNNMYVGGLVGQDTSYNTNSKNDKFTGAKDAVYENVQNQGNISITPLKGGVILSGIVGTVGTNSIMSFKSCSNSGELSLLNNASTNITNELAISGIVYDSNNGITGCNNSGTINFNVKQQSKLVYISGISKSGVNTNNINLGDIVCNNIAKDGYDGSIYISGITYDGKVTNCTNNSNAGSSGIQYTGASKGNVYVSGISCASKSISGAVNNGAITVSGTAGNGIAVGGIKSTRQSDDSNTFIGNVNNGNLLATNLIVAKPSNSSLYMGGIFGSSTVDSTGNGFSNSVNNGIIECASSYAGTAHIGGIIGYAQNNLTLKNCYNNGAVTQNANVESGAGGILGGSETNAKATIIDCFNFGAITNTSTNNNSGAGGIIGKATILSVVDCVNKAPVSGTACIGGIVGICTGANSKISALNYGAISSSSSDTAAGLGGIVGKTTSTCVISAINYGAVSATATVNGGGILGLGNADATLTSCVNYGAVTGTNVNGIIGANGILNMVIFVDPTPTSGKGIGTTGVTIVKGHAYIANNNVSGSLTLNALYGKDFILAPAALNETTNETTYYTTVDTTSSTLAWSEYPYGITKNADGSHTVDATGTHSTTIDATNFHVFALTTVTGRRGGKYIGDNYSDTTIDTACGANAVLATTLKDNLKTTKQITLSRDTSLNYYDANGNLNSDFLLKDKSISVDDTMPPMTYDKTTKTFISTLNYSSSYILNNTTITGGNVVIKDAVAMLNKMFSANARYDEGSGSKYIVTFGIPTYTFDKTTAVDKLITTAYIQIYQGTWGGGVKNADGSIDGSWSTSANSPTTPETAAQELWRAMYSTEYKIILNLFDVPPVFIMKPNTGVEQNFTLTSKNNVLTDDLTTEPLTVDSQNIDTVNYQSINVKWNYGKINATFEINGMSEAYLKNTDNFFFAFYDSTNTVIDLSNYVIVNHTLTVTSAPLDGGTHNIDKGIFKLELIITDAFGAKAELESGTYTYRMTLKTTTANKTFIRNINFVKEPSGDVFLHNSDNTKIPTTTNVSLQNTDIAAISANKTNPATKAFATDNKLEKTEYKPSSVGGKDAYNFEFTGKSYYGSLPNVKSIGNNTIDYFKTSDNSINIYKKSTHSTISEPVVNVRYNATKTNYIFEYTFTITAQNGVVGNYKFTYTCDLPSGNLTLAGTRVEIVGNSVTVVQTATAEVSVANTVNGESATGSYPMKLFSTEVYYDSDSADKAIKIGEIDSAGTATWNETNSIIKPTIELTNNTLKIHLDPQTSGGVYKFVPCYKYIPEVAYTDLPANVKLFDEPGALSLNSINISSHTFIITKTSSKNAFLYTYGVSGNSPSGMEFGVYTPDGSTANTINGNVYPKPLVYDTAYYEPGTVKPGKKFRINYTFPEALTGADYSAWVQFTLFTTKHYTTPPDRYYNDEYTEIYLMKLGTGNTWVTDTKLEKVGYKADKTLATGTDIIDYYKVNVFLPESAIVRIRVVAGNPGYYNDYEIFSLGPLRNKIFNFNISAPQALASKNFIIDLFRNTKYTPEQGKPEQEINSHATTLLFQPGVGGDFGSADLVDIGGGVQGYKKTYISQYYSEGTYSLSLLKIVPGYDIKITNITANNTANLTKLSDTQFLYNTDAIDTVTIDILIYSTGEPPWGDNVFS